MNAIRYRFLILAMLMSLAACKTSTTSEEDPTPTNITKTELLAGKTTKTWETTSIKVNGIELLTESRPCSKDDLLVFNVANTYERNEGTTKCRTNDPQIYEKGKWVFSTDESQLILNGVEKYRLVDLKLNTLKISLRNAFGELEEQTFRAQ